VKGNETLCYNHKNADSKHKNRETPLSSTEIEKYKKAIIAEYDAYKHHNRCIAETKALTKELGIGKKGRFANFPESISELMAYISMKRTGYDVDYFNVNVGDLTETQNGVVYRIESKASLNGPSSFGPTESWHRLIYIKIIDFTDCIISVINIPNTDPLFQKYKLKKKKKTKKKIIIENDDDEDNENDGEGEISDENYGDKCKKGQRPRFDIGKFIDNWNLNGKSVKEYTTIIYQGSIMELLNELE